MYMQIVDLIPKVRYKHLKFYNPVSPFSIINSFAANRLQMLLIVNFDPFPFTVLSSFVFRHYEVLKYFNFYASDF